MPVAETIETAVAPGIVRRRDRGLCVAGKRITLYLIMDYLKAGWPPHLLRHQLLLSEEEMSHVVNYIEQHEAEFEAEYQDVVRKAAEREQYWREREQQRRLKTKPKERDLTPEQAAAWARLQALRREGKLS